MKLNAIVAGVGMTRFTKHPDKGLNELGREEIVKAVADAGLPLAAIEAAYVGNCAAGLVTGQESVRGQVILHPMGVGKIPIINVENACASGSTAPLQACVMVSTGIYDTVLALGVEKLTHPDKMKSFAAFAGAMDIDELNEMLADLAKQSSSEGGGAGQNRSMFMDVYAMAARAHMERYGTKKEHFAANSPYPTAPVSVELLPSRSPHARSASVLTRATLRSGVSHPRATAFAASRLSQTGGKYSRENTFPAPRFPRLH